MDAEQRCIVACTDDSGRYSGVLDQATRHAVDSGARLILYDVTAAGRLSDPRPNQWAGEGEGAQYQNPLDPVELEKLGRHDFALQVQRARNEGVDAYGWLPNERGGEALVTYAAQQNAQLLLLPSELDDSDVIGEARAAAERQHLEISLV